MIRSHAYVLGFVITLVLYVPMAAAVSAFGILASSPISILIFLIISGVIGWFLPAKFANLLIKKESSDE